MKIVRLNHHVPEIFRHAEVERVAGELVRSWLHRYVDV
jgi:hypothetical protein